MALTLSGTDGITFNNSTVQASAGQVLQVVQGSYSTSVSTSTGAEQDTGLTATITPKFSTSKILVLVTQADCAKIDVAGPIQIYLYRNSTNIFTVANQLLYQNASSRFCVNCSGGYLDSPATVSATTYKTTFASSAGSSTRVQFGGTPSTITLMEIAA
jgi:hypothetical protein